MPLPADIQMDLHPKVTPFFDTQSNTIAYVVQEPGGPACVAIDAVMNFDAAAGRLTSECADAMIAHIEGADLQLEWIIETHVHADHLSGAPYLQERLGGKIGIGAQITTVQETFGKVFNEAPSFSGMVRNLTRCLPMAIPIMSARCPALPCTHPATRPRVWCISWATQFLPVTRYSCPTAALPVRIFPVAMRGSYTIRSKEFWRSPMRCGCLCATITVPAAAPSHGKPQSPSNGRRIFTSGTAPRGRRLLRCARRAMRNWRCQS